MRDPAARLPADRRTPALFWPFVPRHGSEDTAKHGFWRPHSGERIERRHPRRVWIGHRAALGVTGARRAHAWTTNLTTANAFRGERRVGARSGDWSRALPAGSSAPTVVLVTDPAQVDAGCRGRRAVAGRGRGGRRKRGRLEHVSTSRSRSIRTRTQGYADIEWSYGEILRAVAGDAALVGGRHRRGRLIRALRRSGDTKLRRAAGARSRARDPRPAPPSACRVAAPDCHGACSRSSQPWAQPARSSTCSRTSRRSGPGLLALRLHLPRRARRRLQHLPRDAGPRGGVACYRHGRRCSRRSPCTGGVITSAGHPAGGSLRGARRTPAGRADPDRHHRLRSASCSTRCWCGPCSSRHSPSYIGERFWWPSGLVPRRRATGQLSTAADARRR